jgi:hypothetical protein
LRSPSQRNSPMRGPCSTGRAFAAAADARSQGTAASRGQEECPRCRTRVHQEAIACSPARRAGSHRARWTGTGSHIGRGRRRPSRGLGDRRIVRADEFGERLHFTETRLTLGISCEAPSCSGFVSFNSLLGRSTAPSTKADLAVV